VVSGQMWAPCARKVPWPIRTCPRIYRASDLTALGVRSAQLASIHVVTALPTQLPVDQLIHRTASSFRLSLLRTFS
jgi:hypothetical protein